MQTYPVSLANTASMFILHSSLLPGRVGRLLGTRLATLLIEPAQELENELCTYHTKHPVVLIRGNTRQEVLSPNLRFTTL